MMSTSGLFILALAFCLASLPFAIKKLPGITPLQQGKELLIRMLEAALMYVILALMAYVIALRWGMKLFNRRRPLN
jgi:hypothetical protein